VAPQWSIDKISVHNEIFKTLQDRDTWQGRLYSKPTSASAGATRLYSQGAEF